jgi:putative redox protein
MVTITVAYKGDLHCEAVHGPSSTTLATDAPLDNGGKAESFSPTDLVATALGTCMLTVMGLKARALDVDIGLRAAQDWPVDGHCAHAQRPAGGHPQAA